MWSSPVTNYIGYNLVLSVTKLVTVSNNRNTNQFQNYGMNRSMETATETAYPAFSWNVAKGECDNKLICWTL